MQPKAIRAIVDIDVSQFSPGNLLLLKLVESPNSQEVFFSKSMLYLRVTLLLMCLKLSYRFE